MASFFGQAFALLGCHAVDEGRKSARCCGCSEEDEILTAAWRERLEKDGYGAMHLAAPAQRISDPDVATPEPRQAALSSSGRGDSIRAPLDVPKEFDVVRYATGGPQESQSSANLKVCLRHFTRSMLRGICLRVLLDDGRTLFTDASLDSELTHLVLYVPNAQHPVSLRAIESICASTDICHGEILTSNQNFLDERCTTLIITGGQFLTFVLESARAREYFETCLKVLVLARESADDGLATKSAEAAAAALERPEVAPGDCNSEGVAKDVL